MPANEQRFRQRYDAAPLKIEIRRLYPFGRAGKRHLAIARNFSVKGAAVLSELKLRPGHRLLLTITSDSHSLQAIPAVVIRAQEQPENYLYGLQFSLDDIPEPASRSAYGVLQRLTLSLQTVAQVSSNGI